MANPYFTNSRTTCYHNIVHLDFHAILSSCLLERKINSIKSSVYIIILFYERGTNLIHVMLFFKTDWYVTVSTYYILAAFVSKNMLLWKGDDGAMKCHSMFKCYFVIHLVLKKECVLLFNKWINFLSHASLLSLS